jgi:hypothetical protein
MRTPEDAIRLTREYLELWKHGRGDKRLTDEDIARSSFRILVGREAEPAEVAEMLKTSEGKRA